MGLRGAAAVTDRQRATAERLARLGPDDVAEITPDGVQRLVAAPLDRLRQLGKIGDREFTAGDQLRTDAYVAALEPGAPGVDWNATGGARSGARAPAMWSAQVVANARLRVRRVQGAVRGLVWLTLRRCVLQEHGLDVVGRDVFGVRDPREAVVAARSGLMVALAALADAYETLV